jgi:biopolymer transport protein ExbD
MRIRGAKAIHYDSGPNMTPLVDVVMVILIFLMLCGSFSGATHYLVSNTSLQVKATGAPAPKPPGYVPPVNLELKVDLDPQSIVSAGGGSPNGMTADQKKLLTHIVTIGNKRVASYTQLKAVLDEYAKNYQAQNQKDKVQVVISPSNGVLYRHLIDVYQAALDAGFAKVAFATAH